MMSDPDLMITIQAYTYMLQVINSRLAFISTVGKIDKELEREKDGLFLMMDRVNELIGALSAECDKRENNG